MIEIERPVEANAVGYEWGSDAIALMLRALDLPFVALTPGASFRGLHDSLVNALGNRAPQMLLCLHEESAVSLAHGYAKVTGKPLGVILHSNVGLMHATMAIFNAWCDRMPMLILGATGPIDATRRRPWVDWIHTARDQAAMIRHYTKWDDLPASIPAAHEAMLRAAMMTSTPPCGPVYVCLDAGMQEARHEMTAPVPSPARFQPPPAPVPSRDLVKRAAEMLTAAKSPLILMGRVSRSETGWQERIALAERLGATVLTDLKTAAAFPTDHPLHGAPPGLLVRPEALECVRKADVVLSLDWVDLAGTLMQAWPDRDCPAKVIQASLDLYIHNGWSMDHQALPPIDIALMGDPDAVVTLLLEELSKGTKRAAPKAAARAIPGYRPTGAKEIGMPDLAAALANATRGRDVSLIRLPLGWSGELWHFRHPLEYLGCDGGGGIGGGPGMAVGAALALQGRGRLPIAILGDGDHLMGVTALWTAAHYRIPLLTIVANNQSFFNDEVHQERVARQRGRPVGNRWIGQHIGEPDIDHATLARGQGLIGIGPVHDPAELAGRLAEAVVAVEDGASVVVDVRVKPGYTFAMEKSLTRDRES